MPLLTWRKENSSAREDDGEYACSEGDRSALGREVVAGDQDTVSSGLEVETGTIGCIVVNTGLAYAVFEGGNAVARMRSKPRK